MKATDFLVWIYSQSPRGYVKWLEDWPCTYPQPNLFDCLYGVIGWNELPYDKKNPQVRGICAMHVKRFIRRGILEGVPGYWFRLSPY